ncbi:MAG: ABC transporter ATP-binding protein, partial [Gammaproteobacteria bacterium]
MKKLLECEQLDIVVADRYLVRHLDIALCAGQMTCLLGENGTGKTSTLHTLAGLLPIPSGQVRVAGKPLDQWQRRELARKLGLLMQDNEDA